MRRGSIPMLLVLLAGCGGPPSDKLDRRGAPVESTVELDDLQSKPLPEWKDQTPRRGMFTPVYQFELRGSGEGTDAEIQIFRGIGGSAEQNIARWKGQFIEPPPGKKPEEAAVVKDIKIGGAPAKLLDISGTTLKKRPNDPSDQGTKLPRQRMIGIHFQGPRNVYQIVLRGPELTVAQYKPGFDEWLKAFE